MLCSGTVPLMNLIFLQYPSLHSVSLAQNYTSFALFTSPWGKTKSFCVSSQVHHIPSFPTSNLCCSHWGIGCPELDCQVSDQCLIRPDLYWMWCWSEHDLCYGKSLSTIIFWWYINTFQSILMCCHCLDLLKMAFDHLFMCCLQC